MRAIILIAFFAIPCLLEAQSIEGIGVIKIGKTYDQIIKDLEIDPKKILNSTKDNIDFMDVYNPRKPVFIKYEENKKADYTYMYIKCNNAYKLLIPIYTIAEIPIKNITLQFFNDTLYYIHIKNPDKKLSEAFDTKYGKGEIKEDKKKVSCSSSFGGSYNVDETTYTTTWNNDIREIIVEEVLSDYRDDKCQQKYLNYFLILDTKTSEKVRICEDDLKEEIKNRTSSELKSKLKDF